MEYNHFFMRHHLAILALLLLLAPVKAQESLTLNEAFAWALNNHPVATMADAVEARGAAALLRSKGAFDPKVAGSYDRKQFLGKEYFDIVDAGVEWQSPYAVKVMGGYESARGIFLNPERTVPSGGQTYLAVKLPLLQGLITDAARIDRQRGDIAVERQLALADVVRNELRYDLATRYAQWLFANRALVINQQTEDLLETYLRDTRELFRQGDKPAVDTLEASIYLATQRLATRQAQVDAQMAKLAFSEMYWPLEEADQPVSPEGTFLVLPELTDWATRQPELRELQLAITDYQLEQRLKREKLKPKLDVSYYLLGNALELPAAGDQFGGPFGRAYKVGATASYPIFNRKARGDVELGQLKIAEGEAKLAGKQQSLEVKADAYRQAVAAYNEQLNQAESLIGQNNRLLAAERELFRLGESTQFLLNVRQQHLQKALLVGEKLRFSRNKSVITWRYLVAEF
jgi:outer membrane protein TolC